MRTASARLHAIVSGRVQGVNFRYYTQQRANQLRLSGWVANRDDGTVEVAAEGPRPALDELLAFLQVGPSLAAVEHVQVEWETPAGETGGFRTRYV